MYKIIGANQVEYGPVTADQLRQWIAEGRVHAQTSAQAVGETTWRPISSFPEFAASFPGSAVPPSSAPGAPPPFSATRTSVTPEAGRVRALDQVSGPAIGLMVTGALGILCSLLSLLARMFGLAFTKFNGMYSFPTQGQNQQFVRMMEFSSGVGGIIISIVQIAVAIFILYAAFKMKNLENHGLCIVASIVALLPCFSPCCCLGLIFGIWALVVLNKSEVRDYFTS